MAYKVKNYRKVIEKARRCQVIKLAEGRYEVTSPTSGETYIVSTVQLRCTCPRDEFIGVDNGFVNLCAHVQAALIYEWLNKGYWLVARAEEADVTDLKRKVVTAVAEGHDHGDGVKFTARKVDDEFVEAKLDRFEDHPVLITDLELTHRAKAKAERYG